MFNFLSKILTWTIMPVSQLIILLLLSLVLKKRKAKLCGVAALILLIFYTNPYIINTLYGVWEIPQVKYKSLNKYDVGIVLTGITDPKKLPADRVHFPDSPDRLLKAIDLYKMGLIEKILITGGTGSIINPFAKEGILLKKVAVQYGVDTSDIILESESRNTYENAKFTAQILKQDQSITSYLLITSAFHMRRSLLCFESQGMNPTPFSVDAQYTSNIHWFYAIRPGTHALQMWDIILKEMLGIIAYRIVGYI